MGADDKKIIDEEAIAEEEFVADLEDTIENPLVYDGDKLTVQEKVEPKIEEKDEGLTGAIGTGGLSADPEPFNNENALRSESVNNDQNPFGADPNSEKAFGGPDAAPLDDATETIAPTSAAPGATENTFGADINNTETPDVTDFSTAADTAVDTTTTATEPTTSEPTIADLAKSASATPTETPATTTDAAATGPKKKKTGLIVGIIVGVLLLAAIIGGIVFYNMHESKERMLGDAVAGLYKADARQFDGKVVFTPIVEEGSSASQIFGKVKDLTIEFKGDNKAVNFSGTGSITLNTTEDKSYSITLGGAYISNDAIFVMIDDLGETVKKLDIESMVSSGSTSADYAKFVGAVLKDVISDAAGVVDGKWYKINAETFGENQRAKEIYECYTKALDDVNAEDTKKKIADIYTAHSFIVFDNKDSEKADGLNYFYVKVDEKESEAFMKDVKELNVYKDLESCTSSSTSVSNSNSNRTVVSTEGDIAPPNGTEGTKKEDEVKADVKVGITGWTHELRSVKGAITAPYLKSDLDLKINYEKKDVPAPTGEAKDITEAYNDVMNKVKESLKKSYLEHGKTMCKENTTSDADYNSCYKELEDYINRLYVDMDGGGIISTTTSALLGEDEE